MSGVAQAATTAEAMRFDGQQLEASRWPRPPTAAFSYSPGDPVTGQSVSFDGSASSCPDAPCTYSWADDPPSGGSWPLGTGQEISFTFKVVGTKYVTLTATDSAGGTASVEHNVAVTSAGGGAPTAGADEHGGAADQRDGAARPDAYRVERLVDREPQLVCLSVAGLRQLRCELREHQQRDQVQLFPRGRRRWSHDAGGGDGVELEWLELSGVDGHGPGERAAAADGRVQLFAGGSCYG